VRVPYCGLTAAAATTAAAAASAATTAAAAASAGGTAATATTAGGIATATTAVGTAVAVTTVVCIVAAATAAAAAAAAAAAWIATRKQSAERTEWERTVTSARPRVRRRARRSAKGKKKKFPARVHLHHSIVGKLACTTKGSINKARTSRGGATATSRRAATAATAATAALSRGAATTAAAAAAAAAALGGAASVVVPVVHGCRDDVVIGTACVDRKQKHASVNQASPNEAGRQVGSYLSSRRRREKAPHERRYVGVGTSTAQRARCTSARTFHPSLRRTVGSSCR
jgi:hypothetical protein